LKASITDLFNGHFEVDTASEAIGMLQEIENLLNDRVREIRELRDATDRNKELQKEYLESQKAINKCIYESEQQRRSCRRNNQLKKQEELKSEKRKNN